LNSSLGFRDKVLAAARFGGERSIQNVYLVTKFP
jgi:hypothetical protein